MRHMSFALTTPQILARTKTVTRRIGWANLKPGTLLQAIEQGQGLKAGQTVNKLDVVRVINARREPLRRMTDEPDYGAEECRKEGFPDMTPDQFVAFFCAGHRIKEWSGWPDLRDRTRRCTPDDEVTRIEFEYVDEAVTTS